MTHRCNAADKCSWNMKGRPKVENTCSHGEPHSIGLACTEYPCIRAQRDEKMNGVAKVECVVLHKVQ